MLLVSVIKVLMMGVDPGEQGGISTLARQIICRATEDESMDLRYLPTTNNESGVEKVGLFLTALAGECKALASGYGIVHLHMANNASFLRASIFSRVAAMRGAKVILQVHCDLERFYSVAPGLIRHSVDSALSCASRVIVMGEYLDAFLEDHGVERNRICLLRNSVSVDRLNPYNLKAHKVLFLGNVCPEKGVLDLLDAVASLQSALPDWFHLDICGRDLIGIGPEISRRGLDNVVSYKGLVNVEGNFLGDYMLNVLPSHNEALPFALLEASAYGIPSIVTNVGTMAEVVEDGRTGWVIPPGDVTSLARALEAALHDEGRLREMSGLIHRGILDRYSFANYFQSLKQLYLEVLL